MREKRNLNGLKMATKLFVLVFAFVGIANYADAQVIELNERQLLEKVCRGWDYDKDFTTGIDYNGDKPCVLLFHNGMCPHAKRMGSYMDKFSRTYRGEVYFYKVNVLNLSDKTCMNFQLEGVPTMIFFGTNGRYNFGDFIEGYLDFEEFEEMIEWILEE